MEWEKIFGNYISNKRLVPRICKVPSTLNNKKTNDLFKLVFSFSSKHIYIYTHTHTYIHPGVEIAQSYGSSNFQLLRNRQIVFHTGYTDLHSHQQYKDFPLHIFSSIHALQTFDDSHSDRCEIISHCYDLHFSNNQQHNIISYVCQPSMHIL